MWFSVSTPTCLCSYSTRDPSPPLIRLQFMCSAAWASDALCRNADIQLDDSAFVDQRGFRTSVMSFADESDVDLSDFGGGWHMILPMSNEDHFKLFEVIA